MRFSKRGLDKKKQIILHIKPQWKMPGSDNYWNPPVNSLLSVKWRQQLSSLLSEYSKAGSGSRQVAMRTFVQALPYFGLACVCMSQGSALLWLGVCLSVTRTCHWWVAHRPSLDDSSFFSPNTFPTNLINSFLQGKQGGIRCDNDENKDKTCLGKIDVYFANLKAVMEWRVRVIPYLF